MKFMLVMLIKMMNWPLGVYVAWGIIPLTLLGSQPVEAPFSEEGWQWRLGSETNNISASDNSVRLTNSSSDPNWLQGVILESGQLEPEGDYRLTFDYWFEGENSPKSYGFVLIRDQTYKHGGGDLWKRFSTSDGQKGSIDFCFRNFKSQNTAIIIGLNNYGSYRISNLRLVSLEQPAWSMHPADASIGPTELLDTVITGAPEFEIQQPRTKNGLHLDLRDVRKDGQSDFEAINFALQIAKEQGTTRLNIPPGDYHLPEGLPLVIEGFTDLHITANGARFIFSGNESRQLGVSPHGLVLRHNYRFKLEGLRVVWDFDSWPLSHLGVVESIEKATDIVTIRLSKPIPASVPTDRIFLREVHSVESEPPHFFRPGAGFRSPHGPVAVNTFERDLISVNYGADSRRFHVGATYLFRNYNYQRHAFACESNRHMTLLDVDIEGFPGSGYQYFDHQEYWQMIDCDIMPPEGEFMSTTADGVHVRQSQGYFKMINCRFARCGDDGLNIHDNVSAGIEIVDAHTLIALNVLGWRNPFSIGDVIEVRSPNLAATGYQSRLKAVQRLDDNRVSLTFQHRLPASLSPRSILFNREYNSANYLIEDCLFALNRARGVLLHSNNGTVRNCDFYYNQSAAIRAQIDIEERWAEGTGIRNLIIQNNVFKGVNRYGWHAGVAIVIEIIIPGGKVVEHRLRDIAVVDNEFKNLRGPAIWAKEVENLIIAGNRVASESPVTEGPYHSVNQIIIE